jgi:hypothetical protein
MMPSGIIPDNPKEFTAVDTIVRVKLNKAWLTSTRASVRFFNNRKYVYQMVKVCI